MSAVTRLPLLCAVALLAYGVVVDCGGAGWIGTPHRAVIADGEGSRIELRCRCGVRVLSVLQRWQDHQPLFPPPAAGERL